MKSGFWILQTDDPKIASLLRLFGFECISADKIYEYDTKKTSLKFIFKGESEINSDIDGNVIIHYAKSIISEQKTESSKKAASQLDEETKLQINSCLNYLKVYEVLNDRLINNTYLEVHIKRNGKLWKIPNIGEDWEKFKKKFNIKGIKAHKDHDRQTI